METRLTRFDRYAKATGAMIVAYPLDHEVNLARLEQLVNAAFAIDPWFASDNGGLVSSNPVAYLPDSGPSDKWQFWLVPFELGDPLGSSQYHAFRTYVTKAGAQFRAFEIPCVHSVVVRVSFTTQSRIRG